MHQNQSLIFDRPLYWQRQQRRAQPFFLAAAIADNLAARLLDMARMFDTGLLIGLADQAAAFAATQKVARLWRAENYAHENAQLVVDEEVFPVGADRLDLLVSGLNLGWVNDVPGALLQMGRALKPDGLFLGALLGGETLHELRAVLMQAEDELLGGISPRVAPMIDVPGAAGLLQRAGFALPVVDHDIIRVDYPDMFTLLRDLRAAGLANALLARQKTMPPRHLFLRAAEIYQQKFAAVHGIYASFNVIYLTGWKPARHQQQPLKRGSAEFRLADALQS